MTKKYLFLTGLMAIVNSAAYAQMSLPPAEKQIRMSNSSIGGTIDNWAEQTMYFYEKAGRQCLNYRVIDTTWGRPSIVTFLTRRGDVPGNCLIGVLETRNGSVLGDFYIQLNSQFQMLQTSHRIVDLDFPEYRGFDKPQFARIYYCR